MVSAAAGLAAHVAAVGMSAVADPPRGCREAPVDEPAAALRAFKSELRTRQYGRTRQIPLKTDRWDVQEPGSDLVAIRAIALPATSFIH